MATSTLVWAICGATLCLAAVGAVVWMSLANVRVVTLVAPDGATRQVIVQGDVRKLMGQDPEKRVEQPDPPATKPGGFATQSEVKRLESQIVELAKEVRKEPDSKVAPPVDQPVTQPATTQPAPKPTPAAVASLPEGPLRSDVERRLATVERLREYDPDAGLQAVVELRSLVDRASLAPEVKAPLARLLTDEETAAAKVGEEIAQLREGVRQRHAADLQKCSPAEGARRLTGWATTAKGRERAAYFLEARGLAVQADVAAIDAVLSSMIAARLINDREEQRYEWLKLASAELLHQRTAQPARHANVARLLLTYAGQHAKAHEYDRALAGLDLADQHVFHAQAPRLEQDLRQKRAELALRKSEHAQSLPAHEKLRTSPDDPDANFVVGRHLCFIENDWTNGLPHLARGSDPRLARIAQQDLANKDHPDVYVAAGDAWWDLAQELAPLARQHVLERAKRWYKTVGNASPELKKRTVARLEELAVAGENPLAGRKPVVRPKLLAHYGGDARSEQAVADALEWLARGQDPATGGWSLATKSEPRGRDCKVAATAMAMLAFQGAGHSLVEGKYSPKLALGLHFLLGAQRADGSFPEKGPHNSAFYAHALATQALSELAITTKDQRCIEAARKAATFAVKTQNKRGGWRYAVGDDGTSTESDTSVTGGMLLALKTAKEAGADVPDQTFSFVSDFLDKMQSGGGSHYGYTGPGDTEATTAEGLLCRQYLGWEQSDRRISAGADFFLTRMPNWNDRNVYYWYYANQVMFNLEGPRWNLWNKPLRDLLVQKQQKSGPERGSWDPKGDKWGTEAGRLFTTCFSTYILEVYYRRLPMYGEPPAF